MNRRQQKSFQASDYDNDGKFHLLVAASGSVATIKVPNIIQGLSETSSISIRIVLTRSAREFLQGQTHEQPSIDALAKYPNVDGIHLDEDEWHPSWTRGAPILHIELRRWAHALFVAPLSANTLAKIANGFCDNLLTSIIRAWEVKKPWPAENSNSVGDTTSLHLAHSPSIWQKPIVVAPSMNTAMWEHPVTAQQLGLLGKGKLMHWVEVLWPIEKTIACGDTGNGAMCEWNAIVERVLKEKEAFQKLDSR
ncbi:MAG: hypothetical protein Q9162_005545 [Coniocarpon cinnabarinum]